MLQESSPFEWRRDSYLYKKNCFETKISNNKFKSTNLSCGYNKLPIIRKSTISPKSLGCLITNLIKGSTILLNLIYLNDHPKSSSNFQWLKRRFEFGVKWYKISSLQALNVPVIINKLTQYLKISESMLFF